MTEPRDEIEEWLGREVEPLAPPPGTFERIRGQARRRKLHQGLLTAAAAVVVIAGGVLVPTVAPRLLSGGGGGPAPVASGPHASPSHRPSPPARTKPPTAVPTTAGRVPLGTGTAAGTGLSATTSGTGPPLRFRPTSITMIGYGIGAVIGQAGTPGHCGPPVGTDCTSLAGTSNYGQSWYGVSAPVTSAPDGPAGVSQLRFLDLAYGWAFGPELWETSDGGRHWVAEQTFGLRVTGLETAGSRAFALLASCQGTGAAYAGNCSVFSLFSSAAGSTALRPVRLVIPASAGSAVMGTAGRPSSASLVIAGVAGQVQEGKGYLLAPSGALLRGSVAGGPWSYVGQAPCAPGAAAASGAPLGAQLAVGNGKLLINCASGQGSGGAITSGSGGSGQLKKLWESSSGGVTWRSVSQPPAAGLARSLAGASQGQVVLATTTGIDYSPDGITWRPATVASPPPGGFSYVGMTTARNGIALPAAASLGEVYVTADGGQTWTPSPI